MPRNIVYALIGALLAAMTLRDVFETVVVPGGSRTSLQVATRLGSVLLPLWKMVRGRHSGVSSGFAPTVLVGAFVIWMALLALAFGLLAYSARFHFEPSLESIPEGIYFMGSAIVTMGLSEQNALGVARWIALSAGFCGLAVMTMAVTYLLQVQSSIGKRDTGIIKLNTSAGNPPSAVTLLERLANLRDRGVLGGVLEESRNWCATVRQSHSAHPTLIYFQSVGVGAGWPAALGALLDVALFAEHCIDDDSLFARAVLLRDEGLRMSRDLSELAGVKPREAPTDEARLKQVARRLESSGYPLRAEPDYSRVATERSQYCAYVDALARHLGKPSAELIPA